MFARDRAASTESGDEIVAGAGGRRGDIPVVGFVDWRVPSWGRGRSRPDPR
jgi:hypothetical protein